MASVRERLLGLPLNIVPADQELAKMAGELKLVRTHFVNCLPWDVVGGLFCRSSGESGRPRYTPESPSSIRWSEKSKSFAYSSYLRLLTDTQYAHGPSDPDPTGTHRREVLERAPTAEPIANLSTSVNSASQCMLLPKSQPRHSRVTTAQNRLLLLW